MNPPAEVVAQLRVAGWVFAEAEARLLAEAARTPAELAALVARRVAGHPLEHVVGWAEFAGLRVAVEPGVFVPRRRTEFLVDQAAQLLRQNSRVVVDMCCGPGAVGLALASRRSVELHAADVDPVAVRCARRNIGDRGAVYEGDLFEPLPAELRRRVDVLTANVPYVPTGELELMPAEARLHEPRQSLDGGDDGLDVLRKVAAGATEWLATGGSMLSETSERQAPKAVEVLAVAMADATITDPTATPDRASFTVALHAARDQVIRAAGVIADTVIDLVGAIGRAVLNDLLPTRRTRVSPRVVKRAISKHRAKGEVDRTNYQAEITIDILEPADLTTGPPP